MYPHQHHHYLFFRHKEMNAVYLSVFLMHLAESMISIFVPIYLYTLHVSIPRIILFALLGNLGSVLFDIPAAYAVRRVGHTYAILISVPFLIVYYLGLRILPVDHALFYILPFFAAARSALYNIGFELNFIQHANRARIGSTLSFMAILSVMAGIAAPFTAGFFIAWFGYNTLFIIGSAILTLSTVPLLLSACALEPIEFAMRNFFAFIRAREFRGSALGFAGYAIESSIGRIIWPVFLAIILFTTKAVGIVAGLSAFATVLVLSVVGHLADRYDARRLLRFGTMLYFFGWLGSVFADSTLKVFFADSYRNISERFIQVPWSAVFYRFTKKEHQLYAVVARDMTFNASRVIVLPFLIAIFSIGWYPFAIAFICASLFTLLYPFVGSTK